MTLGNMRELGGGASLTHNIIWNLPIMDRDLMTCLLEGPSNPMRLGLIGRVETDEEFLSHAATEANSWTFVCSVAADDRSFS
jgi:hypothetical protein